MGFDKHMMTCIHHFCIIRNTFTALKIPCVSPFTPPSLLSPPQALETTGLFLFHSFAEGTLFSLYKGISASQNHRMFLPRAPSFLTSSECLASKIKPKSGSFSGSVRVTHLPCFCFSFYPTSSQSSALVFLMHRLCLPF